MPWTAILSTGAKVLAGSGAKAAGGAALKAGAKQTLKGAVKGAVKGAGKRAIRGAGRKMAGKMFGRGKDGAPEGDQGPQQQDPSSGDVGGEERGGALVKAGSSAIIPHQVQSSALAISQTPAAGGEGGDLEGTVLRIKSSVIKVENLLAGSVVVQEKQKEEARKAAEEAEGAAREGELEKPKDKKQKFRIPQPKVVKSFWQKIMSFIMNTLLGFITVRLLPFMDKMAPVVKMLVGIGEFYLSYMGWWFNTLVTAIDWVTKLVGKARDWIGDTFGEQALEWFDKFSGALNTLINGFLVWKLVGQKIFEKAIGAIKNAWKIAANIVKQAGRFLNWASGGRLGNLGRRIGTGFRRFIGKGGRQFLKAPLKTIGGGIKNIGGKVLQGAKGLFTKGASKVGGLAAKLFGKSAGVIGGAFKAAKPFISKFFGRVPIIGPLIVGIVSLLSGEGAAKAIFKTVGAALGGFLGGALATALGVATVGIGALVAPALVILGETLGVFIGNLLHDLIMGGGLQAAGKKLGKLVSGVFSKVLDVGKWLAGGFKRFIKSFLIETAIEIPEGGGRWTAMTWMAKAFGMMDFLDEIGYVTNGMVSKFPNLLQLYNPFKMIPLLKKSFFPPGGLKEEKGTAAGGAGSGGGESEMGSRGVNFGKRRYFIKGREVTGEEAAPLIEAIQSGNKDAEIDAISKEASYEETVVSPPIIAKEGDGEKTSRKALFITSGVLYDNMKTGNDPYEKLYVGGLG